tara:strand:- start:88 stop:1296 length:1209 start_codon:yes stop_codon:yes gene_type:complete
VIKNDKKPTLSSNEARVAAMIASGKWEAGPNGELLRVSGDSNEEAYKKSLVQANKELQSEGLQPAANSSGFMTPERKAYLNNLPRSLTESEAREWATTSFDPSENPNLAFSLAAGFSAPVTAVESLALKPILSLGSKAVSGIKSLAKPSEALLDITRGTLQGSETTKASHQLFTDFIKKHHPETFSKLKSGALDVADLTSDPKYVDDFANRYSTTYRGVAAKNEEEARRFMTEHRSNPSAEMDGAGIYSSPSAETAATYAATGSSTLGGKAATVLDNEYFRRVAKEGVHPYVGVVKNEVPYKTSDDLWKWLKNNEQMGGAFNEKSGILSSSAQRVTRPETSLSLEDIVKMPSSEGHILKNKGFGNSDHIWKSDELKSILRPTLRGGGRIIKKSGGKFKLLKK